MPVSAPIKRPRPLHALIRVAACEERAIIFTYNHPKRGSELRELIPDRDEPIRVNRRGEKYVIGHDPNRAGPRNFSLSLIEDVTIR